MKPAGGEEPIGARRRLITSEEATPASVQPVKPCTDCPFARASLNGWLGGMSIDEWIAAAHSEELMLCHVHPNVECAGAAIYRANVGKMLRDPRAFRLGGDRILVFATPTEFRDHHVVTPAMRRA